MSTESMAIPQAPETLVPDVGNAQLNQRPLRRDAVENRRRVLEAATEVFARRGLEAPMEEIAQRAGVGVGTLYRRFPHKQALIEELVGELFAQILEAGRLALGTSDGTGLESFLRGIGALQEIHRGWISRMWDAPPDEAFVTEFDQILNVLLVQAQAHGLIRLDCATTDLNVVCWAMRGVIDCSGSSAPRASRRHLDIVLAGLRPDAAPFSHGPLSALERKAVTRQSQRRP